MSQSLFPVTSVHAKWVHEYRDNDGGCGGYVWAHQHGIPLTKVYLAIITACAQSANRSVLH